MEILDTNKTYLVGGKHAVLKIYKDETQRGTLHEYLVVWIHYDTDAIYTTRVDSNGKAFGQGFILKEMTFHSEDYNEHYFS